MPDNNCAKACNQENLAITLSRQSAGTKSKHPIYTIFSTFSRKQNQTPYFHRTIFSPWLALSYLTAFKEFDPEASSFNYFNVALETVLVLRWSLRMVALKVYVSDFRNVKISPVFCSNNTSLMHTFVCEGEIVTESWKWKLLESPIVNIMLIPENCFIISKW